MGYAEFPHTNYSDTDFAELISMYKEVRDKYHGTLNEITALRNRLTEYESDMTVKVKEYADSVLTNRMNEVNAKVDKTCSALTDTLNKRLTQICNDLDEYKSALDAKIKDYQRNVELNFANFESKILDSVSGYFNANSKEYDATVKSIKKTICNFKKEIRNEIALFKDSMDIKPETAKWLWDNILHTNGMSAYEWYKESNLTCEDWNNSAITCINWYNNAKFIFNWYVNLLMLFSPVSGEYITVQEAVVELANKLKINSITAGDYDSLNLTADEFDRLVKNIGEYDWLGGLLTYMFDSRTGKE